MSDVSGAPGQRPGQRQDVVAWLMRAQECHCWHSDAVECWRIYSGLLDSRDPCCCPCHATNEEKPTTIPVTEVVRTDPHVSVYLSSSQQPGRKELPGAQPHRRQARVRPGGRR